MDTEKHDTGAAEVAREIVDEVSQALLLPLKKNSNGGNSNLWRYISAALAGILVAGTLVGVLGRAFFVDRTEYTNDNKANAVEHAQVRQTLDRVARALDDQTAAIRDLQKIVQSQAVDLAGIRRGR
jgi:hypothetical protein